MTEDLNREILQRLSVIETKIENITDRLRSKSGMIVHVVYWVVAFCAIVVAWAK